MCEFVLGRYTYGRDVHIINYNASVHWFNHSKQGLNKRWFSTAGPSHDPNPLATSDFAAYSK